MNEPEEKKVEEKKVEEKETEAPPPLGVSVEETINTQDKTGS